MSTTRAGSRAAIWWRAVRARPTMLVGLLILTVVLLAALIGPWLPGIDAITQHPQLRRQGPSWSTPLGRDAFGRGILSRIVVGARATLAASATAVAVSAIIGTTIGLWSGYRRGFLDMAAMRGMDMLLSIPYFLLAILIVAIAGPGLRNAALAVGIAFVPQYARVVRASALETREREYVEAAVSFGLRDRRIVRWHILPNVIPSVVVLSTVGLATAIMTVSGLSFIGLGAQPPNPEWGAMLAEGREYLQIAPHISVGPGLAILLTVLSLNLVGDGLRDLMDPRQR